MKFVEIARFSSRLVAETIGHALDQYDIPFFVQSPDIGIFGPGMTFASPFGASLRVPEDRLAEVEELLNCVVRPAADAEDEPSDDSDTDRSKSSDD
jgi:hypothetical protein